MPLPLLPAMTTRLNEWADSLFARALSPEHLGLYCCTTFQQVLPWQSALKRHTAWAVLMMQAQLCHGLLMTFGWW